MKEEQIRNLKEMLIEFKKSQGERRHRLQEAILAYLDGCLAGIDN